MKRRYIESAIVWNGRIKAWVRARDMNFIEKGGYWTPAFSYPIWTFKTVYPYEEWMEEYVGTDRDFRKDDRFNKEAAGS